MLKNEFATWDTLESDPSADPTPSKSKYHWQTQALESTSAHTALGIRQRLSPDKTNKQTNLKKKNSENALFLMMPKEEKWTGANN